MNVGSPATSNPSPAARARAIRTATGWLKGSTAANRDPVPDSPQQEPAISRRPRTRAYRYDNTHPKPPEADQDSIELLARARGPAAVKEAETIVATIDSELHSVWRNLTDLTSIQGAIAFIPDLLQRRRVYTARAAALRRALSITPKPLADPPALPDLLGLITTYVDSGGGLHQAIASKIAPARKELASVERDIKTWETIIADEEQYRQQTHSLEGRNGPNDEIYCQDACLERLTRYHARRRELLDRIAVLEGSATQATALVSSAVKAAVKAAGGRELVVSGLIAADALSNAPSPSNVRALESQQAEAEAAAARLESAGVTSGPALEALNAKLADVEAQLVTARKESADRRRASQANVVDMALEGNESARAQLERIVTQWPGAFNPGFGDAIASSRFDHVAFATIAATLATVE
jgi:hypothetical protein